MMLEEQRSRALPEQAASQKEDSSSIDEESLASLGSPAISAKDLACMSQGRLPSYQKPHVIQNVAGEEEAQEESGSLPVYSKEEEETILLERMPKKNLLQGRTTRTGKVHIRSPKDRNEQLNSKKKVSRHYRHNRRRRVTEKSADKSETVFSSRVEGQPSKSYSFRSRSKVVSYVSQQEEEEAENSRSEGSSVEDWLPEKEGYDAEEEEDPDEMEVEEDKEKKREEESEAGARRRQAGPPRKNPKKTVRSYQCPECSRKFNNSSNMRKHLRIHKGERIYGCHACGKSYTDPSNLAHHQRMHTGERPYLCPTCPKAFSLKMSLDAHIRQHLGIRPFSCLQCGSTFCSRAGLVYHMKGHDRRPTWVRCEDCDKTFSGRRQLYKHRRRHRNLVCEDCGEAFAFKYKYKFHRTLHKTCVQCGVSYIGMHLCNEQDQQPKCASRKSSALVPHGAVADQTVDTAAHARGLKQPISSAQAATESTGAERPSVSVSTLLPTDGQVRLSNPAPSTCLKEISRVAHKSISASQQTKPLASVSLPVLESGGAKLSTLSQTLLQLKPPCVLLQNVPSAQPVTSSPTVAKPFAQIPALLCPAGPVTNLPHTQALAAFSISSAAPTTIILLTNSNSRLWTVTAPLGPMLPSGSDPVTGAANNDKISMNPATLPSDPKIPSEKIALSKKAQICAICQTEYAEKHQCTKLPQDPNPCHESVPRLSLKVPRNKLDEQLEEVEREIRAIMEFWEQCFVEDTNLESPWISKWHLGHPLDLNDKGVREDPLYDEGQVEQEALHDYMTMLEEQRARALLEQATSQKEDSSGVDEEFLASLGSPAISAKVLACMSQGRLPTYKKPHVIQNVAGEEEAQEESGSLPVYSKEDEETILLERMPKKNLLQGWSTRTGKVHIGNLKDRNEQLNSKKKVSGHYHNHWQQVTEQSADKSETCFSSHVEGQPSEFYNFRSRSKVVSYVSQQEEEAEKSWSEGSSGEDWLPEEEGSDAEEEEDPDEMEVEEDKETAREEESEAGSRRGQTEASVSLPVLESRGAKPSTLSQTPLQLKPPGVLLQNVPSAQPVTSSPTVAKPFAPIPALLWPAQPATNLPHTQASGASSISSAAPPMIYLLTDSNSRLLTITAPLGPMQPSNSNPVTGAADNDLIPMNPASLPSDPKIPSGKSVPSIPAQICATCQTESVEKHQCTKLPQDPNPCHESVPRHALKERGNKLDKQLEEVEREIKAIVEFWEHSFVDGKEGASPESPWINCATKETDLELQSNPIKVISEFVNKFLQEQAAVLHIGKSRIVVDSDPERISACQPLPSTSKAPKVSVKVKQPEPFGDDDDDDDDDDDESFVLKEKCNNRAFDDTNNVSLKGVFDSRGRLIPSAEVLASMPQGRWTIRKKIYVNQRIAGKAEATREKVQGELGSPPISNKKGKAAILPKKAAKRNPEA